MNSLADMMRNAGFEVENEFVPLEKISEEQLPFGSCLSMSDKDMGTDLYNEALKTINFFRREAEEFRIENYDIKIKNYIFDWLKDNADKCRVLPKLQCEKVSHGNLGLHTDYWHNQYERDARYGTSDLVFKFVYKKQYEMFDLVLDAYVFNYKIPEQKALYDRYNDEISISTFDRTNPSHKKAFDWFVENVFPKCEFIPIEIDEFDGCVLSHREYKDYRGVHAERTSPCLGKNIKSHEGAMEKLDKWLSNGGYIRDDKFYLIIEDRDACDGSLYLRPWKVD